MKLLWDLFGQFYEARYSPDRSWSGYLSEDSSRNSLRIFYILYLVFGILNYRSSLLLCSGLSGFSLSSVFWLIYCTATTSAVLSSQLESPTYSTSYLNWYKFHPCPLVFNSPLNEIARTQFFVRWVDCNTPFPEYVLSCVFSFSIVFFALLLVFDRF